MKKILLAVSFAMSLTAYAGISVNAGDDFTVTIPDGWQEIPSEVLDDYAAKLKTATGKDYFFAYGYQPTSNKGWFRPPYVLVNINRSGRIPQEAIDQFDKYDEALRQGEAEAEGLLKGLIRNVSAGNTSYDPHHQIIWTDMAFENAAVGQMRALSAVKLTKYGRIQLYGYSLEQNQARDAALYKAMFESLILPASDEYSVAVKNNSPQFFGLQFHQFLIGGSLFGLFGLAILFFKMFTLSRQAKQA